MTGIFYILPEVVRQNFGLPSEKVISDIVAAVQSQTPGLVINSLKKAIEDGASAVLLSEELLTLLRNSIAVNKPLLNLADSIKLIEDLLLVQSSSRPDIQLEIALLNSVSQFVENPATPLPKAEVLKPPVKLQTETKQSPTQPAAPPKADSESVKFSEAIWEQTLSALKGQHNTLYGLARMAKPDYSSSGSESITLRFDFPFHLNKTKEAANEKIIVETLSSFGLNDFELICELNPKSGKFPIEPKKEIAAQVTSENLTSDKKLEPLNQLEQIRDVFGGVEVIE